MESRHEMDMLEKLEELKDINARHASGLLLNFACFLFYAYKSITTQNTKVPQGA